MKKILLIFLFIIFTDSLFSQVNLEWIKRFPNQQNASSLSSDMVIDRSGNIYVAGSTAVSGEGLQIVLLKYKPDGSNLWIRYFGGAFHGVDGSVAILKDKHDNVYLTGYTTTSTFSALDIATIKFDSSGTLLWSNIFSNGVGIDDYPYAISIDSSLNVFVSGFTYGGGRDGLLIKLNSNGVQQWFKTYRSFSDFSDEAYSVCADFNGNSYIALLASDSGNGNIGTIKYDPGGNVLWNNKFRGLLNSFDYPSKLVLDNSNNVYVVGTTDDSLGYDDFVTIKYGSDGSLKWLKTYNGTGNNIDNANYIVIDEANNCYVTGPSVNPQNYADFTTIKYNPFGELQWVSRFRQSNSTYNNPVRLVLDRSNNIYVTGNSRSLTTNEDFSTVKYNNNGIEQWNVMYNGSSNGDDFASAIITDQFYNVYITGSSFESGISEQITILKYSQPIGIIPVSSQIPAQFSLSQNYPNPFNPATKIKFDIPASVETTQWVVSLKIHDILGREVAVLVNEQLRPGSYEVDWDASAFPSGVYFYTITSGSFKESKKMVLLK
jgi:hypothetical protein